MSLLRLFNPLLGLHLVLKHRGLLLQMIRRNVAARYKGSVLGIFWSFAQPLMMLAVYTFVFGIVFKARWGVETPGAAGVPFPLIMFCGMAVFNIFAESVNTSAGVIVGNASYVKKVIFPLEILPLTTVISSLIFGLAWFVLLLAGMAVFMQQLHWTALLLPVTLIPLLLFSSGLAFFISSLGVYLRDTQQLVGVATQVLFFMTPIFYPISIVPERVQWILKCNPLSPLVEETRKLLLFGQLPNWTICGLSLLVAFAVFQLGFAWFCKTKKGFADVI